MPPKSGSATDSNGHSKNPRLEPTAEKHSCKIPIAKPEIVNNSEYDKDISILISQKFINVSRQSLTRAHAILLENTKTKETRRVVAHIG